MQRHNTARPTARLRARAAAACIAVVVTSVGVTACGPGRPDPDTAAQALADGISSGDLADVPLSGSTPTAAGAQLAAAIAGRSGSRPAIVVGPVSVDDKGEAAEAPLAFTWDVDDGDQDWTYSTTAHLDLVEDEWVAQWSLSVVSPDLVPGLVLATHRVAAERANVLGADGVALVEPRPVLRLGVDKTRVDAAGQPEAARQVAELLGLDPGPYAERVAAGGGDTAGLSGLQLQYDAQLRGRPGLAIVVLREDTGDERELFHLDPVPGEPLVTTLDPRFQDAAESVLEPVGPASAIVAMRSSGEVLAAASGSGGEGYSTATLGTYAPGSSFKVVGSLALLRAGLTPDSPVECPASITVDGRVFNNFPDYPSGSLGSIPLRTAVAQSCNTAFIGSGDLVSQQALVDAAATLGLGVEQRLGFPAFLGSVPVDSTGTDHAASMIGQGRIQVSPLAMATVAASVAGGRTVVPWLVGSAPPEAAAPTTPLTSAEADALRALMRGVVTDGGARFLQDVPGPEVLAKTGTAQTGSGADLHNHVWMIAVQGDLAVAVFVETGGGRA